MRTRGYLRAARDALRVLLAAALCIQIGGTQAAASDPCTAWVDMRNAFVASANGDAAPSGGLGLQSIYRGISPNGGYYAGFVPHIIMFAIGAAENSPSPWQNNVSPCGNPPSPFVHGDGVGWGTMAVTSGRVDADRYVIYNVSHGARILIDKWNAPFGSPPGNPGYSQVNNNDPNEIEDWFFAIWGYNGFTCSGGDAPGNNNPADHPGANYMNWAPSQPRDHYTYQDVVYYYIQNPPADSYSVAGPGGKYYLGLNIGYGAGNNLTPGRGIPAFSTFTAGSCPIGVRPTTTGIDRGYWWSFSSQSYATTQSLGSSYFSYITVDNTGNNVWYNVGSGAPKLGTADLFRDGSWIAGYDHASPFQSFGWISSNRLVYPGDATVYPVSSGMTPSRTSFVFYSCPGCINPASVGSTYAEHYDLVIDGATWFPDIGVFFEIAVQ